MSDAISHQADSPILQNRLKNRLYGNPLTRENTRALLLGSGELGREVALELMRLGVWVCAADSYAGAPASQFAHESRVLDMADPSALRALIAEVKPDIIIPEVEAIATAELSIAAQSGIQVTPSSDIAAICMDRERLRVLAHETLGLPTTPYRFADSLDELRAGAQQVGYPCVVKPVMSSSGHGQSVVRDAEDIADAWVEAQTGRRAAGDGAISRVIVEALVPLDYELTVLTVSSSSGIVTCSPIGQRQESGDYRESWQPAAMPDGILHDAGALAKQAVQGLVDEARSKGETGWGVFGVELFVLTDGTLLFNEVSPRPHDTGMVTLISQRLSEFALHARAILGIPVSETDVRVNLPEGCTAASRAIVVTGQGQAVFSNLSQALSVEGSDLRIFNKPELHGHRRMAVALTIGKDESEARAKSARMLEALSISTTGESASDAR